MRWGRRCVARSRRAQAWSPAKGKGASNPPLIPAQAGIQARPHSRFRRKPGCSLSRSGAAYRERRAADRARQPSLRAACRGEAIQSLSRASLDRASLDRGTGLLRRLRLLAMTQDDRRCAGHSFPLPSRERVASIVRCEPGEGAFGAVASPTSRLRCCVSQAPSPARGEGRQRSRRDDGERRSDARCFSPLIPAQAGIQRRSPQRLHVPSGCPLARAGAAYREFRAAGNTSRPSLRAACRGEAIHSSSQASLDCFVGFASSQ